MHLWRAVDDEGEVLAMLVQRRRDKAAALKLMRKLLKKHGFAPTQVTADSLRSFGVALREVGRAARHERGRRQNNRAEVSHQPVRLHVSLSESPSKLRGGPVFVTKPLRGVLMSATMPREFRSRQADSTTGE